MNVIKNALTPDDDHSPYGGSQAHRWINCPGSIRMTANMPKDESSSPAAIRGTTMHEIAAKCLTGITHKLTLDDVKAAADKLSLAAGYTCDNSDLEHILEYVDYCYNIIKGGVWKTFVEQQVSLDWISPLVRGTVDFAAVGGDRGQYLYVGDYKTGHFPVSASGNEQLMMYALGILGLPNVGMNKIEGVVFFIAQPNILNWEDNRTSISSSDLILWGKTTLSNAYNESLRPDSIIIPGDHCKFCRAKSECSAYMGYSLPSVVQKDFPNLPDPERLSPEQIAEILDKADQFKSWLEGVRAYAEGGIRTGSLQIPGYGIEEKKGRKTRSWSEGSELALSLMYGIEIFDLKSVAALEKQLGKSAKPIIDLYVKEKEGNPSFKLTKTFGPDSVSAANDFLDV